jgi:hypothetical protein
LAAVITWLGAKDVRSSHHQPYAKIELQFDGRTEIIMVSGPLVGMLDPNRNQRINAFHESGKSLAKLLSDIASRGA